MKSRKTKIEASSNWWNSASFENLHFYFCGFEGEPNPKNEPRILRDCLKIVIDGLRASHCVDRRRFLDLLSDAGATFIKAKAPDLFTVTDAELDEVERVLDGFFICLHPGQWREANAILKKYGIDPQYTESVALDGDEAGDYADL